MTDVIKCFFSEITLGRRAAPATVGMCICGSRAPKDPCPPFSIAYTFTGEVLTSAEVNERRFRLLLFLQTDAEDGIGHCEPSL